MNQKETPLQTRLWVPCFFALLCIVVAVVGMARKVTDVSPGPFSFARWICWYLPCEIERKLTSPVVDSPRPLAISSVGTIVTAAIGRNAYIRIGDDADAHGRGEYFSEFYHLHFSYGYVNGRSLPRRNLDANCLYSTIS
ncbi:MAG: hypothetical protein OXU36_11580 [Candidatus Poribacteria bacterium]|nr:hypothetical protein [Candidatus Poribacteria bacterium]